MKAPAREPHGAGNEPPAPFVVGVPRSGTTLVRLLLDAHPQLAIGPETGFLEPTRRAGSGAGGRDAFLAAVTRAQCFPDFHLDPSALAAACAAVEPFTVAGGLRAFYRAYAARWDKPRWGDKTPIYLEAIERIAILLPEARFIHVIRDPRDVVCSWRRMWFAPSTDPGLLAAHWRTGILIGRAQAARVAYATELRLEGLVADPEAQIRRLCRFLELDFAPEMLRAHTRAPERLAEHEARRIAGGRVISKQERADQQRSALRPPDPGLVGRWRTALAPADVDAVERTAGDLMDALGYARAGAVSRRKAPMASARAAG